MENIFNLKNNYTKNDLTNKFNEKIKEINNLNISLLDKNLLIEQYDKEYKKLFNKFVINNIFYTFRNFENPNNQLYSNYSSFSSQTDSNGNKTINQYNKTNNNGIINEVCNRYLIDKNGNKIN
jgi:hypothetical protein